MELYSQEQINEFDKKTLKGKKVKHVKWAVDFKKNETPKHYTSIKELADDNPILNYDTWRNISVGRSRVYGNFINLENVSHKKLYLSNVNQEPIITQNLEPSNEENVL